MVSSPPKDYLSLAEKFSFFKTITIPLVIFRSLIFPPPDSPGVKRAIVQHLLKSILSIPIQQQRAYLLETPTGLRVTEFCAATRPSLVHKTIALLHEAKLHLIGSSIDLTSKTKILLFFHGGSYLHSAAPSHIPFAYSCSQSYSTPSTPAILAVLEYTLSHDAPYPRQLQQAISALNHILGLTSPSNIIMLGDSAGGHLALSLMSQILHPETEVSLGLESVRLGKGNQLRGLCLVSPGLSVDIKKESYTTNASTDYISSAVIQDMISNLTPCSLTLSDVLENPQLSPGDAPTEHWVHFPASQVLITVGEKEVLYSACVEFASKLKETGASVKLMIGEGEWHVAPIIDPLFGLEETALGTRHAIMDWMGEMCARDM